MTDKIKIIADTIYFNGFEVATITAKNGTTARELFEELLYNGNIVTVPILHHNVQGDIKKHPPVK